jgi:hypothetical protein
MTTFIADFIFGKSDRRPRSRPSQAARFFAQFRPPVRPQPDATPTEAHRDTDARPALIRRATSLGPKDGLAG